MFPASVPWEVFPQTNFIFNCPIGLVIFGTYISNWTPLHTTTHEIQVKYANWPPIVSFRRPTANFILPTTLLILPSSIKGIRSRCSDVCGARRSGEWVVLYGRLAQSFLVSGNMASSAHHSKPEIPRHPPESLNKSFRNPLVEASVHRERERFSASIRDEAVCSLAASYHNGDACEFFKAPIRGSYNICYFVQFYSLIDGAGDKWVVRVPLAPCLAFGSRSKLESEVATMQ